MAFGYNSFVPFSKAVVLCGGITTFLSFLVFFYPSQRQRREQQSPAAMQWKYLMNFSAMRAVHVT
jgi:hypothetical protein